MTIAEKRTRLAPKSSSPATIGRSCPLGATFAAEGVNFSLFSRTATGVELVFFDHEDDAIPSLVVPLDPASNRTYHYWHTCVPGVLPGQLYGYRVKGPRAPERGLLFDPAKVLLDPYGRGVVIPKGYDREAARRDGDDERWQLKNGIPHCLLFENGVAISPERIKQLLEEWTSYPRLFIDCSVDHSHEDLTRILNYSIPCFGAFGHRMSRPHRGR